MTFLFTMVYDIIIVFVGIYLFKLKTVSDILDHLVLVDLSF